MFSILILTKNEEANLPGCLDSVRWCDDIVVLDSLSTDATAAVAEARGARVFQREFDDFGAQRNHALDRIEFKHPWVFHLDADERFNDELRAECEEVIRADRHSAYFVANRIFFLGRWVKHSSQYPYHQVRLLKIGEARFAKAGHGQREHEPSRGAGYLSTPYDHFNFSKGIADWVDRHNRYATEEAAEAIRLRAEPLSAADLWSGDSLRCKRALKRVHARLPARWVWKFLFLYVGKGGFLDGGPGLAYCSLNAFYDFLIAAKIAEPLLREPLVSHPERTAP